jgi:hypothetical protein
MYCGMYEVRLNDVTIQVKKQNILIYDIFGDMSDEETDVIIAYLADEGFIDVEKEIHVFVKYKSFIQPQKKERQKKS